MNTTSKILIFAGLCLLAATPHAAEKILPIPVRAVSEQWGDELEAKGNYRDAFAQYRQVWSQWHLVGLIEAEKRGRIAPETQENLERLMKKVAGSLEKLNPPPAVPEEAVFAAQKGASFVKLAKDARDFKAAIGQFERALYTAPWVGDYHYNLAVCQKSAGELAAALRTLRLADILARDQKETRDILALRAEIEVMSEIKNRK